MEVRVLKPEQLGRGLGVVVGGDDGGPCPINYRLVLALQLKKTTGYLGHISQEMLGTIIFALKYLGCPPGGGRVERTKHVVGK
jgi:hypothetical protein